MKAIRRLTALAACAALAVALAAPAMALLSPTSDFYVNDNAGVLSSSTEQDIVEKNDALYAASGAQIVVVTVNDTEGLGAAEYSYQLANDWGIGSAQENNGVLLLLSIGEQDYQCIQGSGLEDTLPTMTLSRILQEDLEPDFAAGDYDAGVQKTFNALYYQCIQGSGLEDTLPTMTLSRILQEDLEPDFAAGDYDAGVQKTFNALYEQVCSIYGLDPANPGAGLAPGYEPDHSTASTGLFGLGLAAMVLPFGALILVLVVLSSLRPRYGRRYYGRPYPPRPPYRRPGPPPPPPGMWGGMMGSSHRRPPRSGGSFRMGGGGSFRSGGGFRGGGGGGFRGGGAGRGH